VGVFVNKQKALEIIQGLHVDGNKRADSAPELVSRNSNNDRYQAHSLRGVNGDRKSG
jgi:hypothetical protein